MMGRILLIASVALFIAGQIFAWRYWHGFDALDPQMWRGLVKYAKAYGQLPPWMKTSISQGAIILCALLLIIAVVVSLVTKVRARTLSGKANQANLHGSARWAEKDDLKEAALIGRRDDRKHKSGGVVVGGIKAGLLGGATRLLTHDGPEHVLAFAPTGSGKGVGLVLPTLLRWKESAVVLDIKGENHALSAGWRASVGQRVLRFDPLNPGQSCRFNPLAEIRIGTPHAIADAQNIAVQIIDPDGKGLKDFWMQSGFGWLSAGILHVLIRTKKDDKRIASLADVARTMDGPEGGLEGLFQDMLDFEHGDDAVNQLIRAAAQGMKDRAPNERSGVHSSAMVQLKLYADPLVSQTIAESDFQISDLMNGDTPMTLYLVLPPSDIDRLKPLIRIILNLLLTRLTSKMDFAEGASVKGYKHRLLLLLDEFTSIGKLELFERAIAFMRGYGIKAFIIIQDIEQLRKEYTREESIMSNCGIRVAFAPNKAETARLLSDMTGKATVVQKKSSHSAGMFQLHGNVSTSTSETARPLLTPDECMRLPGLKKDRKGRVKKPGDMLIFPAGFPPIYGRQPLYFQDKVLLARAKMPPPVRAGEDPAPAQIRSAEISAAPLTAEPDEQSTIRNILYQD